jgi:hypothetical protein
MLIWASFTTQMRILVRVTHNLTDDEYFSYYTERCRLNGREG